MCDFTGATWATIAAAAIVAGASTATAVAMRPKKPKVPKAPDALKEDAVDDEVAETPLTQQQASGDEDSDTAKKGRSSLRVDLATGVGSAGGTGLST